MILNLYITSMETKVYVSPEEISKYNNINMRLELNINKQTIVKIFINSIEIPILKINWSMSVNYLNPNIGYIRLSGIINCQYKDPETMLTNLPNDVKNEISNAILITLASYIIETSRLHNLPSPIPIPKIDFNKTNNDIKNIKDTGYHGWIKGENYNEQKNDEEGTKIRYKHW